MTDAISSILDGTLDDLADLPGFKVPPTGAYGVEIVSILEKKIGEHPAVEAKFKVMTVEEVTEKNVPDSEMAVMGDEFNVVFMLDNDTGLGFFKEFTKPLSKALGNSKLREVMELAKGMSLLVVIKRTYDEGKDRHYLNLKKIDVL